MADIYVERMGKEKDQTALEGAAVITTAIQEVGGIIQELEKVAISSPIASAFICLITGDILHNAKIISDGTWLGIEVMIYSAAGLALGTEVITAVSNFTDLIGNRAQPNLFTPSVNTLVIVPPNNQDQLNALFQQLTKTK